jgi:hypothetical protein
MPLCRLRALPLDCSQQPDTIDLSYGLAISILLAIEMSKLGKRGLSAIVPMPLCRLRALPLDCSKQPDTIDLSYELVIYILLEIEMSNLRKRGLSPIVRQLFAHAWQAFLAPSPSSRRSSPAAFDEGSIGNATPRAVRHDRVDPARPKVDAQILQFPTARHRPRCLCVTSELYRSLAPTNPAR